LRPFIPPFCLFVIIASCGVRELAEKARLWTLLSPPLDSGTLRRMKDLPFQFADIVREIGFSIHSYHGAGHLEKVYENALVSRLRKKGLFVEQQKPLTVYDEDGTVLGEYYADLVIEGVLIVEVKAARAAADEHVAQLLGYLRSARIEHGVLVNFGAPKFYIRKLAMSESRHRPSVDGELI
jgi:GxxExxY protein